MTAHIHDRDVIARLLALAEIHPRRAVRLTRRLLQTIPTGNVFVHARVSYVLGWSLLLWERFDQARPFLDAAQHIFNRLQRPYDALRCEHGLLRINAAQLRQPDLESAFTDLTLRFSQIGAARESLTVQLDHVQLATAQGHWQDAQNILSDIEPAAAAAGNLTWALWLWRRGVVAISSNDFAYAAMFLEKAENQFAKLHQRLYVARCWADQGVLATRLEKLDYALECYQRAEHVFRRLDLPLRMAFSTRNTGLVFMMRGEYDQALTATLTALEYFTALGRASDVGGAQLNLGNIHFYTGRMEAALANYVRAEALCERTGMLAERLLARRNRAMVYRAHGRLEEARTLLDDVEQQAWELRYLSEVAEVRSVKAALHVDEGQNADAMRLYAEASTLFDQIANAPAAAECRMEQGWLALRSDAFDQARMFFQSAEADLQRHPHHHWRISYGLGKCAEASQDVQTALHFYEQASAIIAGLRLRLASEEASSALYNQAAQFYTDAIHLASASNALEKLLVISESQRGLTLQRLMAIERYRLPESCRIEHNELRIRIEAALEPEQPTAAQTAALDELLATYNDLLLRARHHEGMPPVEHSRRLDLAKLCTQLNTAFPDGWTALVYVLLDGELLIITYTDTTLELDRTPVDARLRQCLDRACLPRHRRFTYLNLRYMSGQEPAPWKTLTELSKRLIPEQVHSRLHDNHRLLIAPSGLLHALPWSALRIDDAWLCQRAVVQLVPGLLLWSHLATSPTTHEHNALLLGCSQFGGRAADLPNALPSLDLVQRYWHGPTMRLEDAAATRKALLTGATQGVWQRYRLLHFATHAQFIPNRGMLAHMKLADRDLFIDDILWLGLRGALVVLAACDGAAHEVLSGEEVLSLSRAFLAAGARDVVASLWKMYDHAILEILEPFYAVLAAGEDAPTALAHAQRMMITRYENGDTAGQPIYSPLVWASLSALGAGATSVFARNEQAEAR